MADIKISTDLFALLIRYHLMGQTDDDTARRIRAGLDEKSAAIYRRRMYEQNLQSKNKR